MVLVSGSHHELFFSQKVKLKPDNKSSEFLRLIFVFPLSRWDLLDAFRIVLIIVVTLSAPSAPSS